MAQSYTDGNHHVKGRITAEQMTIPDGTVTDAAVASNAGIAATKLQHRHQVGWQQPNTAATTETRTLFVARGTGAVQELVAGSIAAAIGNSTVTIDLKKNGASILTAVITLDNANTARVVETGTISSAAYVAGDWFELVITATVGTGTLPTGVFAQATLHEFT